MSERDYFKLAYHLPCAQSRVSYTCQNQFFYFLFWRLVLYSTTRIEIPPVIIQRTFLGLSDRFQEIIKQLRRFCAEQMAYWAENQKVSGFTRKAPSAVGAAHPVARSVACTGACSMDVPPEGCKEHPSHPFPLTKLHPEKKINKNLSFVVPMCHGRIFIYSRGTYGLFLLSKISTL